VVEGEDGEFGEEEGELVEDEGDVGAGCSGCCSCGCGCGCGCGSGGGEKVEVAVGRLLGLGLRCDAVDDADGCGERPGEKNKRVVEKPFAEEKEA
jgi:hypothetical protein